MCWGWYYHYYFIKHDLAKLAIVVQDTNTSPLALMALNVFKTVMFRFQESANQEQSQEKVCKSDIQTKSIYIIKMLNIKYWLLHDKYKDIFYYLLTKDQAVYYSAATELWAVMRLMMIKTGVPIDANVLVSFYLSLLISNFYT